MQEDDGPPTVAVALDVQRSQADGDAQLIGIGDCGLRGGSGMRGVRGRA